MKLTTFKYCIQFSIKKHTKNTQVELNISQ